MNILREIGQMGLYDIFLWVAIASTIVTAYMGYWTGWCWVFERLWLHAPEWLVRPHPFLFLAVNITGVIITLLILNKAG